MRPLIMLTALVAGALMPLQAGVNARLRVHLGDALSASLVSFCVGTVALFVFMVVTRAPWPGAAAAASAPWWSWLGGTLGAFFVAVTVLLAFKLGATGLMAWIIAGQLVASLLLDHYGVIGFPVREVTWQRLAGVGLLLCGALLVNEY
ncbi:transporter family-2 protein [Humidesulfovibrio mexicanus]|uniref:Transporter family-2 protein n=1 Tax=Humidesulfovibrio mexicanus TaxID=147047 RepID=A0A238ZW05_9BACT|nr:DMT family transporter [Humidesulfovibrio mexicanus]SNR87419.1 transporter family-2 protein [Humidesulfovibrio mexicanus]